MDRRIIDMKPQNIEAERKKEKEDEYWGLFLKIMAVLALFIVLGGIGTLLRDDLPKRVIPKPIPTNHLH